MMKQKCECAVVGVSVFLIFFLSYCCFLCTLRVMCSNPFLSLPCRYLGPFFPPKKRDKANALRMTKPMLPHPRTWTMTPLRHIFLSASARASTTYSVDG